MGKYRQNRKILNGSVGSYFAEIEHFDLSEGVQSDHIAACSDPEQNLLASRLAFKMAQARAADWSAVYVIGPRDLDIVKIGISADPLKRLGELQVGNWHELVIHALIWADVGAGRIEALAHKAAVEMGVELRGEWIALDAIDAVELALKAARYGKINCSGSDAWLRNWTAKLDALAESKGLVKRIAA